MLERVGRGEEGRGAGRGVGEGLILCEAGEVRPALSTRVGGERSEPLMAIARVTGRIVSA